jgi:lysophospholipase L1-like esterase
VLATMSNDVGFGYSAEDIMEIVARIVQWAQADFPDIRVYCFSDEPTLKHKGDKSRYTRVRSQYNEYLETFCKSRENCIYVPIHEAPFFYENPEDIGDYDKIREDIFHTDVTHLNIKGYNLFLDYIRELFDDML